MSLGIPVGFPKLPWKGAAFGGPRRGWGWSEGYGGSDPAWVLAPGPTGTRGPGEGAGEIWGWGSLYRTKGPLQPGLGGGTVGSGRLRCFQCQPLTDCPPPPPPRLVGKFIGGQMPGVCNGACDNLSGPRGGVGRTCTPKAIEHMAHCTPESFRGSGGSQPGPPSDVGCSRGKRVSGPACPCATLQAPRGLMKRMGRGHLGHPGSLAETLLPQAANFPVLRPGLLPWLHAPMVAQLWPWAQRPGT